MYYVDREQIDRRLQFIPVIIRACEAIQIKSLELSDESKQDILHVFARERALQLAIETVTDIGSLMIDGFIMRDASSYEDIVEILHQEKVFGETLLVPLLELVKLRKLLTQDFMQPLEHRVYPLVKKLPQVLEEFARSTSTYLNQELGEFTV